MTDATLPGLAKALAAAQAKLKKAAKDSENPYFSSRYADLESVIDAMRAPFAAEGLSVVQSVECEVLKTTILHVSGEQISSYVPFVLTKKDMQAVGSAITYARRYGLAAACGISQTDDDGNAACEPPPPKPQQQKPKAEPKPQPKKEEHWMDDNQSSDAAVGYDCAKKDAEAHAAKQEPFDYSKHSKLVDAAGTSLNCKPLLLKHRHELKAYLIDNAWASLDSVKDCCKKFLAEKGEKI
jgi:hypothetical protein